MDGRAQDPHPAATPSRGRPPTGDQVAAELAAARVLERACPSACARPLTPPADGVCPDCGRPIHEAA